ncbi:VanZ family protein [Roseofilum casamattae]|uniref:VanZ family protein n=1 Tax=Roseofilum casamattae BLCC-M143 TaxID=3022442 RepID=A0ABT7BSP7_9CYAN|nr:VanZ family protein [Roseofilum casamattae]MDJ1182201.1 VanZ family protein [Roseofilum casamattae BLCC-M143]
MMTSPSKRTQRAWIVAFWLYFLFLMLVSLAAYLQWLPEKVADYDKAGHLILIGTAGILSHQALGQRMMPIGKFFLPLGPVLVTLFSAIDETLQMLSPARSHSLTDLAANWIGIWLFYGIFWIISKSGFVNEK